MTDFKPYADDAAALCLGGLTVENGRDRIAIHGSLDVARDAAGLAAARRLHDLLGAMVARLEAGPLDAAPEPDLAPTRVGNPFA